VLGSTDDASKVCPNEAMVCYSYFNFRLGLGYW